MSSRLRIRKKSTRIETPDISTSPAQGMFQSRPFVVQTHSAEKSQQQPDLKTALMRAQRYGHHLHRMQPVSLSDPTQVVQRMQGGEERSPTEEQAQEPTHSQFIQSGKTNNTSKPLGLNIQPLVQRESAGAEGVKNENGEGPFYRGGSLFQARAHEVKIDKKTGFVKPTHGISVHLDADKVRRFGGAYKITSLPDTLRIIQRGKDIQHYEIVPREVNLTFDQFNQELGKINAVQEE